MQNTIYSRETSKRIHVEIGQLPIFADPTYDMTFKKLFGQEANKKLLISILNSFLDFTDQKLIVDLAINDSSLERRTIGSSTQETSIDGAVDVLCTTASGQKIAIEMQRQKTKYFLAREQEYMSKLISGQVKEGEGKEYHDKVLETYIIIIAKNNLFTGDTKLLNPSLYEIDVIPTIKQTGEVYPRNKMHWKFFELPKFQKHQDSQSLDRTSPLKLQWLSFLLTCSTMSEIPDDINDQIKEAYNIMKTTTWSPDDQTLYWKQQQNEIATKMAIEEAKEEGKAEGKAEGIAKGKIDKLITLLEFTEDSVKLSEKTGFTQEQITTLLGDKEHISVKASQLLGYSYDLLGDTSHDNSGDYS